MLKHKQIYRVKVEKYNINFAKNEIRVTLNIRKFRLSGG